MRRQRLKTGIAGTLRFIPPEGPYTLAGSPPPPASATCSLFTPAGVAIDSGDVEAPVLTALDGLVSAGAASITVDDVTEVRPGARFYVGDPEVETMDLVRVRTIDTTLKTLLLWEPLANDHADAVPVQAAEMVYLVADTFTATALVKCRADWTYEVDGTEYTATTLFDIATQPFKLHLTALDLRTLIPHAVRQGASDVADQREFVLEAEDRIVGDLERLLISHPADAVRNREQLRQLAIWAIRSAMLLRAADNDVLWTPAWERAEAQYTAELERINKHIDWLDVDDSLTVDSPNDSGIDEQVGP